MSYNRSTMFRATSGVKNDNEKPGIVYYLQQAPFLGPNVPTGSMILSILFTGRAFASRIIVFDYHQDICDQLVNHLSIKWIITPILNFQHLMDSIKKDLEEKWLICGVNYE